MHLRRQQWRRDWDGYFTLRRPILKFMAKEVIALLEEVADQAKDKVRNNFPEFWRTPGVGATLVAQGE